MDGGVRGVLTHAWRRPELRRRVAGPHDWLLDNVGSLVEEWARRWGIEFRLPPREVVRGIYAITSQLYAVLLAGQPGGARRLTMTIPLPEMVAALNDFRPEALTAYPSVAAMLAEEQLQGRLRIAPRVVGTSSEVLTADMRRRIGQAWGLEPIDFYGTTEAVIVAAGRQGQAGMDVLEDLVVVEVVDEHDRPVPPGVPGHGAKFKLVRGQAAPSP